MSAYENENENVIIPKEEFKGKKPSRAYIHQKYVIPYLNALKQALSKNADIEFASELHPENEEEFFANQGKWVQIQRAVKLNPFYVYRGEFDAPKRTRAFPEFDNLEEVPSVSKWGSKITCLDNVDIPRDFLKDQKTVVDANKKEADVDSELTEYWSAMDLFHRSDAGASSGKGKEEIEEIGKGKEEIIDVVIRKDDEITLEPLDDRVIRLQRLNRFYRNLLITSLVGREDQTEEELAHLESMLDQAKAKTYYGRWENLNRILNEMGSVVA